MSGNLDGREPGMELRSSFCGPFHPKIYLLDLSSFFFWICLLKHLITEKSDSPYPSVNEIKTPGTCTRLI